MVMIQLFCGLIFHLCSYCVTFCFISLFVFSHFSPYKTSEGKHISTAVHLLSCSWRPPRGRPPAPPSEGRWDEAPSRSLAPQCSCSRSTSPTPHPDKCRSLWRCARSGFLEGRHRPRSEVRFHGGTKQPEWRQKAYVHCWMAWSCPWGSRGNYTAAQRGDTRWAFTHQWAFWTGPDCRWWCFTLIWACWSEYSMDWKMCQVYLRLISVRATYCRYHRWIRTAALKAETRGRRARVGHRSNSLHFSFRQHMCVLRFSLSIFFPITFSE